MTYRNVDHTPDGTLAVCLKYFPNLIRLCEVTREGVNFCAILVLGGGVGREVVTCDLSHSEQRFGCRVVMVVQGDDLEPACLLETVDDMGTYTSMSKYVGMKQQ